MHIGKTTFVQVLEVVRWTSFARIVQRPGGNSGLRALSCADLFRAMAVAHSTSRESLRQIEASLSAHAGKLPTLLDLHGAVPAFIHISDQWVMLDGFYSARKHAERLRGIRFKDPEQGARTP